MPNNNKVYIRKTCVEITFRAEEGLPLVATPYIEAVIEAILARAQSLYSITVCHYVVMGNHIHIILVVNYPERIPQFIGYLKAELSHATNSFLGREKHTVWCEGYDSPIILDGQKAIDRIVYLYTNPQKANLVDKIEDYPNCSSWQAFLDGGSEIFCHYVPRSAIPKLPRASLSRAKQEELRQDILEQGEEELSFFVDPDAWMECFPEFADANPHLVKNQIISLIRKQEDDFRAARKQPVIGAAALRLESMRKKHTPQKRGKRMLCLSSIKSIRAAFIAWYKGLLMEARAWYVEWRKGNKRAHPPAGMFAPGGTLFANLNPALVPVF